MRSADGIEGTPSAAGSSYERLDAALDDFEEGRDDDALRALRAEAFGADDPALLARIADIARQMLLLSDDQHGAGFAEVATGVERQLAALPDERLPTPLLQAQAAFARGQLERVVEYMYAGILETDEDEDEDEAMQMLADLGAFAESLTEQLPLNEEWRAFDYARAAIERRQAAVNADEDGEGDSQPTDGLPRLGAVTRLVAAGQHSEALQELRAAAFAAQEQEDGATLEAISALAREIALQLDGESREEFTRIGNLVEATSADAVHDGVEKLVRLADEHFDAGDIDVTLELLYEAIFAATSREHLESIEAAAGLMRHRVPQRNDVRAFEFVVAAIDRRGGGRSESATGERPAQVSSTIGRRPAARGEESPELGGWIVPVFFFGILGGLVGWLVLKETDPRRANHVLKWGAIWTTIGIVGSAILYAIFLAIILGGLAAGS